MTLSYDRQQSFIDALKKFGSVKTAMRVSGIRGDKTAYKIVKDAGLQSLIVSDRITNEQRKIFAEQLAQSGRIRTAAVCAGISRDSGQILKVEMGHQTRHRQSEGLMKVLQNITGLASSSAIADHIGISYLRLKDLSAHPETISAEAARAVVDFLREKYPAKKEEIAIVEKLICVQVKSAAKLKLSPLEQCAQYRDQVGSGLREWREACGLEFGDVQRRITVRIIKDTLQKIEDRNEKLAISVFRQALVVLPPIYEPHDQLLTLVHSAKLQKIREPA